MEENSIKPCRVRGLGYMHSFQTAPNNNLIRSIGTVAAHAVGRAPGLLPRPHSLRIMLFLPIRYAVCTIKQTCIALYNTIMTSRLVMSCTRSTVTFDVRPALLVHALTLKPHPLARPQNLITIIRAHA